MGLTGHKKLRLLLEKGQKQGTRLAILNDMHG